MEERIDQISWLIVELESKRKLAIKDSKHVSPLDTDINVQQLAKAISSALDLKAALCWLSQEPPLELKTEWLRWHRRKNNSGLRQAHDAHNAKLKAQAEIDADIKALEVKQEPF